MVGSGAPTAAGTHSGTTMNNFVTLAYFYNGKRIAIRYETKDPKWREVVKTLQEQNKFFRLLYI